MSPRIIHIPLSSGDRKAQAKGSCTIASFGNRSLSAALPRQRSARLIGWSARPGTRSCGPAVRRCLRGDRKPSRRSPRPSTAAMICWKPNAIAAIASHWSRCGRSSSHDTPVWKLEAALYCEPCSTGRHYSRRQRAHILGLTYARPDPD
jgi:hypothetical protein